MLNQIVLNEMPGCNITELCKQTEKRITSAPRGDQSDNSHFYSATGNAQRQLRSE